MTQQQAQAIEQALERARKENIRIIGEGHMKATHQRFFLVSSADYCQSNRVYVVRVLSTELHCNCRASGICKHRAVVHQALKDERLAEQEREAERLASLPRELAEVTTSEAEKLAQAEHREAVLSEQDPCAPTGVHCSQCGCECIPGPSWESVWCPGCDIFEMSLAYLAKIDRETRESHARVAAKAERAILASHVPETFSIFK